MTKATVTAVEDGIAHLDRQTAYDFRTDHKACVATIFPLITAEENVHDVRIENLVLDGNRQANAHINGNYCGAVFIQCCNRWQFRNVTARNYNGDGFSAQICDDVAFESCQALNNADLGFHPGSGSQRPVFRNCLSKGNGYGIYFCWDITDGIVEGCVCVENRIGIHFAHRDTDNVIRRTAVERNTEVGIVFRAETEFRSANRNTIEDCIVRDNGIGQHAVGIDINGKTKDITIRNTRIEASKTGGDEGQVTGIRIGEEAARIVLEGNVFVNCVTEVEDLRQGG